MIRSLLQSEAKALNLCFAQLNRRKILVASGLQRRNAASMLRCSLLQQGIVLCLFRSHRLHVCLACPEAFHQRLNFTLARVHLLFRLRVQTSRGINSAVVGRPHLRLHLSQFSFQVSAQKVAITYYLLVRLFQLLERVFHHHRHSLLLLVALRLLPKQGAQVRSDFYVLSRRLFQRPFQLLVHPLQLEDFPCLLLLRLQQLLRASGSHPAYFLHSSRGATPSVVPACVIPIVGTSARSFSPIRMRGRRCFALRRLGQHRLCVSGCGGTELVARLVDVVGNELGDLPFQPARDATELIQRRGIKRIGIPLRLFLPLPICHFHRFHGLPLSQH